MKYYRILPSSGMQETARKSATWTVDMFRFRFSEKQLEVFMKLVSDLAYVEIPEEGEQFTESFPGEYVKMFHPEIAGEKKDAKGI